MRTRSVSSAASVIARISTADPGSLQLRHSVAVQLGQVVDFDAWRFSLADPISVLPASSVGRDAALHHRQRSWYEVLEREPAFAGLMGTGRTTGVRVLSAATAGALLANRMWQDVLRPSGFGDAMFVGLGDRRRFWGTWACSAPPTDRASRWKTWSWCAGCSAPSGRRCDGRG